MVMAPPAASSSFGHVSYLATSVATMEIDWSAGASCRISARAVEAQEAVPVASSRTVLIRPALTASFTLGERAPPSTWTKIWCWRSSRALSGSL
ncbi:hypothetical protein BCV69DRAFT_27896 [Microstroma glucosiphilum]|uniref:Uncharacterized protein n=1 Tax=Pseudomicrostroma glucosiphilum TaxID=1684307 RepID=A0A316U4F0_9BASI|nr:hypothetical protein BCV69DRAFT_27896 [Pseudomicrostroma glucosiphilum]PWN19664.1 hypothetical protein BCV69DRAFT_27896 [Pseudomicrostroma glucosiphilum]